MPDVTLFSQYMSNKTASAQTAERLLELNSLTVERGLSLSREQALALAEGKNRLLVHTSRIEFGVGALKPLIDAFSRSTFISPDEWYDALTTLGDIFYGTKTDSLDRIGDGELIAFMFDRFENYCGGDLTLLAEQCEILAMRARAGLGLPDGAPERELPDSFKLELSDAKTLYDDFR